MDDGRWTMDGDYVLRFTFYVLRLTPASLPAFKQLLDVWHVLVIVVGEPADDVVRAGGERLVATAVVHGGLAAVVFVCQLAQAGGKTVVHRIHFVENGLA